MFKLWNETSWEDYVGWQHQDDKIVDRINILLKKILFVLSCKGHYE